MRTDSKAGYIEEVEVHPANESELKHFESVAGTSNAKRLYADKGFASKKNRQILKALGISDGIMEKAAHRRPLSYWQKLKNKLISSQRFIVERAFGTLKGQFHLGRASYKERRKVEGQMRLKALCYNLLKASRAVYSF